MDKLLLKALIMLWLVLFMTIILFSQKLISNDAFVIISTINLLAYSIQYTITKK